MNCGSWSRSCQRGSARPYYSRHVGQLTEHEIAEVTGVTRGTVARTLRAAYARLDTLMTEEEKVTKETPSG